MTGPLHWPSPPAWGVWDCGGRPLDLNRPQVMGVLNVTPDSFSDGGRYQSLESAVERALTMREEGAAIIDVGGESTRPGAVPVSLDEELRRVVPVVEALARVLDIPVSVDTRKPEVMRACAMAGAGMINDVSALSAPGALETAAAIALPVCLMHMRGEPATMQRAPRYGDVVDEVFSDLAQRLERCVAAGISGARLLIDPGFGFGKSLEHNYQLLHDLPRFQGLGCPILVGISRKSMIGQLLQRGPEQRLPGSLAAALCAFWLGASLIRTHEVAATVDALSVWTAVREPAALAGHV